MKKQKAAFTKKFFRKDKTGRGFTAAFSLAQITALDNEKNWDGDKLHQWAMSAEEGNEFENAASKFICTQN